jgi:hypothetical protein
MKYLLILFAFAIIPILGFVNKRPTPTAKKYVYFTAYAGKNYYSKIFTFKSYTDDEMNELKNCIIEQVQSEAGRDKKVSCKENKFDSYSKASEAWQEENGKRMFFDSMCDIISKGM